MEIPPACLAVLPKKKTEQERRELKTVEINEINKITMSIFTYSLTQLLALPETLTSYSDFSLSLFYGNSLFYGKSLSPASSRTDVEKNSKYLKIASSVPYDNIQNISLGLMRQ